MKKIIKIEENLIMMTMDQINTKDLDMGKVEMRLNYLQAIG